MGYIVGFFEFWVGGINSRLHWLNTRISGGRLLEKVWRYVSTLLVLGGLHAGRRLCGFLIDESSLNHGSNRLVLKHTEISLQGRGSELSRFLVQEV
jgi:hypothetical protein